MQYMTYALHPINVEYICQLSYRCEIAFNVKLFWSQLTLNKNNHYTLERGDDNYSFNCLLVGKLLIITHFCV